MSQVMPRNKGNKVVGGIEYNKWNRPIGYWFRQYDIEGSQILNPVYVEAKDVIFYFTKRRPSQIREMSDLGQTVTRIRDTNEFMTAVSVKERIAACLAVFIKKTDPSVGPGRGSRVTGEGKASYEGKTIVPGMIRELAPGDGIEIVNPNGQATDAATYIKLMQHMIGAGQGLSYEATSRDMSQTNYSSARQGMIEDGLTYADEKELLLEVMDEVYETFVISCVLAGIVNVKDFWSNKDRYLAHKWTEAPKKWIDPAKEATANKIAIATGQKTFKEISAENGRDWREQMEDILEVLEYAENKGLNMGGVMFGNESLYKNKQTVGAGDGKGKP